jgi:signal transduction histidine kinase/DNA-binding response OmpR family regulator
MAQPTSNLSSRPTQSEHSPHVYAQVGQALSKIFTAKQHGGHNQNWTSIQSDEGFIYVGHTTGISQWDGENWSNYSTPHSTPVRSISKLHGQLYFGTNGDLFRLKLNQAGELSTESLLSTFSGKRSDSHSPAPVLDAPEFGEVWSTASNSDGVIFVSREMTFFFDGNNLHEILDAKSSKHKIFNINNDFIYKPKDLPNFYRIETSKTSLGFEYSQTKTAIALPAKARVMEVINDSDGSLVIVTERHGVYRAIGDEVVQVLAAELFAEGVQLYDAILSSDGFYYVSSTYNGLFILDKQLKILRNYDENDAIGMNTIFSVNEDIQGNIWLTGIPNVIRIRPPHIISEFTAGSTSTELLRLKNTSLGIFVTGNGQFALNMPEDELRTPSFIPMSTNIESSVDLMEIDGVLLKAAYGGFFELKLDSHTSLIESETKLLDVALGRPLVKDENGFILAASSNGAFLLKRKEARWEIDDFGSIKGALISLTRDKHDTLWLGSPTSELFKLDKISRDGTSAILSAFTQADGLGYGPVYIFNVDGNAIFSSAGNLFVYEDGKLLRASNSKISLPIFNETWLAGSNVIDSVIQTPARSNAPERIWYRKNGHSGYFEKTNNDVWIEHSAIFDSVESGGFSDLFLDDSGVLWFVRDKAEIYRVDINKAEKLPQLAPLNVRYLHSKNHLLDFNLASSSAPILEPQQNDIRFSYASSDNASPSQIMYRSRLLKNKELPWSSWSEETYRDFTQLSPGTYRFEVQAIDAWQRINTVTIPFTMTAPWYQSTTAYILYAIFALLILFMFAYVVQKWRTKALEAANLALEQKVDERTKEVNEKVELLKQQQILKDRFFGNVSHEFRTPLTLTIGPLETLVTEHRKELNAPVTHLVTTALNNASKMLALVGQVLDLNRLEAGKLPLRIAQYDVADLLRNVSERFQSWAAQNKQTIEVLDCQEPLMLWFDMDQLDKCISNLVSNAIKYSGEETQIQLQLISDGKNVEIRVRDNGVGISDGAKSKVFERFYQDGSSENRAAPGTGIGLALVKEIMEIHHGEALLLDSGTQGCCFVLKLKQGNQHFSPEQIIEPIDVPSSMPTSFSGRFGVASSNSELTYNELSKTQLKPLLHSIESEDITTLLIVDDNKELLNFISLRLSASYRIIQAMNGQEGYQKACEELPDLIISDVNMPIMTGLELTEKIKENKQTHTIPIILLTAKATKREVVVGFSVGADDYLTKPFDTSELIMRVNALINARKLVRETHIIHKHTKRGSQEHQNLSFKDKVIQVIESQLAEPSFKVEQLASKMHMSRDTLIRKCKKECGDTPLNLIIKCRMEKADELLQQQSMSVSEVAYACGFESLAYFSKSYKKQRGVSPSEALP